MSLKKRENFKIREEVATNNTAGVEVKNPDAIPKKKRTFKELLKRISNVPN
jgi:hypothetical protein